MLNTTLFSLLTYAGYPSGKATHLFSLVVETVTQYRRKDRPPLSGCGFKNFNDLNCICWQLNVIHQLKKVKEVRNKMPVMKAIGR